MADNTIASAYIQLVPSAKGIKGSIKEAIGGEADDAGRSAGSSIASLIKGAIAAAGIGTALKTAITEGANLEQSIGGIETLFKDSFDKMLEYANQSFKTTGLSANDYMETVTSFSASLLQGLGGDTAKAADVSNMAMVDMADNANKFGTDMQSIQNAYQGFAKQNYTMLDNLKLGYGGTKSEMERLLSDAEKLTGVKYDINNLSDVYNAIHEVQTELGVTGTTAKEASSTISGSFNSMKAAAMDLLANMTLGNDVSAQLNNLKDTVISFAQNILPALGNIIGQAPQVILDLVIQLAPMLISAGTKMITDLISGLAQALPTLIPAAVQAVVTIVQGLISASKHLIEAALQLITGLADGMIAALPVLINALPTIIESIISTLVRAIPQIIETGVQLLTALVTALPQIIQMIVAALPRIISSITAALLNNLPVIIQTGITLFTALINNLPTIINTIITALPQIITAIINAISQNLPRIIMAGVQLFVALITNLPQIIITLIRAVPQIIMALVNGFSQNRSSFIDAGKNLLLGLGEGIGNAVNAVIQRAKQAAQDIVNAIKNKLGIKSPSRVMMQVGGFIDEGLAEGISDNIDPVKAAMNELSDVAANSVQSDLSLNANVNSGFSSAAGQSRMVTMNVYPSKDMNEKRFAEYVNELLNQWASDEERAYA